MKKRIRFIINPKSGTSAKKDLPDLIRSAFDTDLFEIEICFTERARHAYELSEEAAFDSMDIVAVAGGDGTVNEAAGALLYKKTALAILPFGSGNGLARHLEIPIKTSHALDVIRTGRVIQADTFHAGPYFGIGTFGLGFDAHVAHLFAKSTRRGYATYVRLVLGRFFNYQPVPLSVSIDDQENTFSPFLFSVANSSQFGNNAIIAPAADIQDGLLDIAVIDPFPAYEALGLILRLTSNRLHRSGRYHGFKARKLEFRNPGTLKAHIDGEPVEIAGDFSVNITPASVGIIVPSAR